MQHIGTKIFSPLRLCAKRIVKYPSSSCISWIKNTKSFNLTFPRNYHKQIEDPNQSNSFKNALEFVKAHPAKSIQAKKLNIKGLQLSWALAIFLNNQEAYPFVKHSENRGDFTETWINDNIFEKNKNISKSEWVALEKEVRNISVADVRHCIKVLRETVKYSKEGYNRLATF